MRVLVTGGAGYIGSVVVEALQEAGAERVVVLDDLSKGHRGAVVAGARLVEGSIQDAALVSRLCREERMDAVVHMAASSLVPDSVRDPARYYANNVAASLSLVEGLREAGVRRLVLSSTAAVYGEPSSSPITEAFPTRPTNPYGETKLVLERALGYYAAAYALSFTSLRYFNAAGATERNGEDHDPETQMVPIVLSAARGEREAVPIYGDDYPTPDGTCVRDYIHVSDLAQAHVLALRGARGFRGGGGHRRGPRLQPGDGQRLHGAPGDRGRGGGDRAPRAHARGATAARGPGRARGPLRPHPR